MSHQNLSKENAKFWSEPCGITASDRLNLNPNNKTELALFDEWYISFYPYLFKYLQHFELEKLRVLEIGIGMGTVSRYLASRCLKLDLLDIAPGAIEFVKSTIPEATNVDFHCRDVFDFSTNEKFDLVVAIGSLHHTGDLNRALDRVEDLVKTGGFLLVMVYNAFQPRRFVLHPLRTLQELFKSSRFTIQPKLVFEESDENMRAKADSNRDGSAPPYTAFSSRKLFLQRSHFRYNVELQNFHRIPYVSRFLTRELALKFFSKYLGCDIYALGRKLPSTSL